MNESGQARIESVFVVAISLQGTAREAYLASECANDGRERAAVEALLAAAAQAEPFFCQLVNRLGVAALINESAAAAGATPQALQALGLRDHVKAGDRVGAYTLTELLASGGMGSVWRGVRNDGRFEGCVAIKFLHIDGSTSAARRFELEGSYLAKLTHPNIARLLDAGVSAASQPYLVMEYVDGTSIDHYAEHERLTIAQRIALFLSVLSAVEHAHANLIVHRDIKPSNVLVTAGGVVKLLDFGIAKLLQADVPTRSVNVTCEFGVMLTPEYAAPEQVLGLPVTTTTDVYSLGLLLYKLLTGRHARDLKAMEVRAAMLAATTTEPRKPSEIAADVLAFSTDEVAAIAKARCTTPHSLRKTLRGDLDNIIGKALALEPGARYQSVPNFAEDLRRYLCSQPVTAQAHTVSYRVTKFVRRHRGGVLTTAVTMLVLVAATSMAVWQARVAAIQRGRAELLADRNITINSFLYTVITDVTRTGAPISTRQMLERSELLARREFARKPEHLASIMQMLATNYRALGDLGKAEDLLQQALDMTHGSRDYSLRADVACEYGMVLSRVRSIDTGRKTITDALDSAIAADIAPLSVAGCLQYLSFIAQDVNDGQSALQYAQRARAAARQSTAFSAERDATYLANVAYAYHLLGMTQQADDSYAASLNTYQELGLGRSPHTLTIRSNSALVSLASGNPLHALKQYDLILEIIADDDPLGVPPPHFLANRAIALELLGRLPAALEQNRQALKTARDLGNDRWIAYSLVSLAEVSRKNGDIVAADRYIKDVAALNGKGMPQGSSACKRYQRTVGRMALTRRQLDTARAAFNAEISFDKKGNVDLWVGVAELELVSGNVSTALEHARRALALAQSRQGGLNDSSNTGLAWLMLGRVLQWQGHVDAATEAYANAERNLIHTVDGNHPALIELKSLRPTQTKI